MLTKIRTCTATLLLAAFMVGCATPYQSLPVRTGTVTETQQSLRKVFQPSAGGALADFFFCPPDAAKSCRPANPFWSITGLNGVDLAK